MILGRAGKPPAHAAEASLPTQRDSEGATDGASQRPPARRQVSRRRNPPLPAHPSHDAFTHVLLYATLHCSTFEFAGFLSLAGLVVAAGRRVWRDLLIGAPSSQLRETNLFLAGPAREPTRPAPAAESDGWPRACRDGTLQQEQLAGSPSFDPPAPDTPSFQRLPPTACGYARSRILTGMTVPTARSPPTI